jgi:crossover junction endodeoxyribonuclease RuvC
LGVDAAHIYGGLLAILSEECERRNIPYSGVPVGSIKRHATGKGNADKEKMLTFARARWGKIVTDDNHADALWILDYVQNGGGA